MTYNKDGTVQSQQQVYFRVRDLAVVYEYQYNQDMGRDYNTYWTEYINGGLVEYDGVFTDKDFELSQCDYSNFTMSLE